MAIAVTDLNQLRGALEQAGYETLDEAPLKGRRRFFTSDPFGNRMEFLEPASG